MSALSKDRLSFNLDFGQDGDKLYSDSILIGGSEYGLDGARKHLLRLDQSGRISVAGPLARGSNVELANASIETPGNSGADRVSGVVTITSTAAHGASIGDEITISGVTDASFNGRFVIETVPSGTTFTYSQAGADATSGNGSVINHTRNPAPILLGAVDSSNNLQNLQVNGSGELLVSATVTAGSEYNEDDAHVSADNGTFVLSVRQDTLASSTSADGDYQAFKTDSIGALWTRVNGEVAINDGGNSITVDGSVSITGDVNVTQGTSPWVVSATDLDIRDLDAAQDNVAISDGTDTLAINGDGSINITDNGGSITVDGSVSITGDVNVTQGTSPWVVSATDLDIRDIDAAQDNIAISDGTDTLAVNADGSINTVSVVTGNVADDAADAGNPLKVGSRAVSTLPAAVAANDRADVISDLRRRLYVNDAPNIGSASAAVSVTTTSATLGTPLAFRTRVFIQNLGNRDIFVGPSGVTIASGLRVSAGATLSLDVGDNVVLHAVADSGTQNIRMFELA